MLRRTAVAILILAVLAAAGALIGKNQIVGWGDRPIALEEEFFYQLDSGTSFRSMAAELEQLGVVEDSLQLRLFARLQSNAHLIKTGEYRFTPGMTHGELLKKLVQGDVVQRRVTFVEGLRARDFIAKLSAEKALVNTLGGRSEAEIARELGIEGDSLEGWIYPDTYSYTRGTTDKELLVRAYRAMVRILKEEWAGREKGLPLKTPYEALILASIVEKETAAPEERARIAGVFIRRLEKKMRLQTDPTVIYGMGDAYRGNITRADLRRKTPYNTYRISGLTPTPIASPGRDAIHAVLHPEPGKALYFVAKGDGRHQFSATLAEHNRAVKNWQLKKRRKDYRSVPKQQSVRSDKKSES